MFKSSLLVAVLAIPSLLLGQEAAAVKPATRPVSTPYPGVTYRYIETTNPNEHVFAAIIDLKKSGGKVRVSRGGPDSDGPGPIQTHLIGTTAIAEREGFDIAVNGDYFKIVTPGAKDAEGEKAQQVFVGGRPATVAGPAMTDGELWSTPKEPRPALLVHKDGKVSVEKVSKPESFVTQAIAGNIMLVEEGKALYQDKPDSFFRLKNEQGTTDGVGGSNSIRHPRTCAGVSKDGNTLILMVVDGRAPAYAAGMNWKELARQMADLGSYNAVNLDGGGSSTFVLRDPATGKLHIENSPSDKKERSVANAVGVTFPKK
jgi:exopolysaccharide biosynthesis protein